MAIQIARPMRTGVRVHVVAGYDVHAHIRWRPTHIGALAPRHRHGRLAATVVKQIHVCVAKVFVRDAVDDVVKARLCQTDPERRVERSVRHRRRGVVAEHDAERQPERDEYEEAVEISARQLQVPLVVVALFEVRSAHEALHVDDDANVADKREHDGQQNHSGHDGRLVRLHVVAIGARTVVKVYGFEGKLQAGGQRAHAPDEQQQNGGLGAIEERRNVLRCAESQIVLDAGELR